MKRRLQLFAPAMMLVSSLFCVEASVREQSHDLYPSIVPETPYEVNVGGPKMSFDMGKMDPNFPQMEHWITAGVEGGVPDLKSDKKRVKATFTPATFSEKALNAKIKELSSAEGGVILLKDGAYTASSKINMASRVTVMGESQDGVVITIDPSFKASADGRDFSFFLFGDIEFAGLRNLTIKGGWLNEDGGNYPKHPWNDKAIDELPEVKVVSVKISNEAENCFVDQLSIINCALHPILAMGDHCTVRNCYMDGAFKKGGGCQGYFFIGGSYNLVTGNFVTHIRHISLQTPRSFYNVVYDNLFYQEVSFHTADGGNNLIEANRIILPEDMPAKYHAIMGPWASFHKVSAHPNYLYNNSCLELNHGGLTPWSESGVLYDGPYFVRPADHKTNFGHRKGAQPIGGTLYPVK